MSNLFFENQGTYSIALKPEEISNNITMILTQKIKEEIEGICVNDGYIKKDSVKVIGKSMGKILVSYFNGYVLYNIKYISQVCNPVVNDIVKAQIKSINKMGIIAVSAIDEEIPLNILLALQHHIGNEQFKKLQENDTIYVKVAGKRFEYGDTQISVIGKLVDKPEEELNTDQKVVFSNSITYFNTTKKYKWLGNFNIAEPFIYKNREYATVEHAFQSQKNTDPDFQDLFTKNTDTYIGDLPNIAKKSTNKTNMKKMKKKLVDDWDDQKLTVMEDIIREYYNSNKELKQKLIKTGENELIYKGVGVDAFWGLDKDNKGENNHGKILMKLRGEFN